MKGKFLRTITCVLFTVFACIDDRATLRSYMLENVVDDPKGFEIVKVEVSDPISIMERDLEIISEKQSWLKYRVKKENIRKLYEGYKLHGGVKDIYEFHYALNRISVKDIVYYDSVCRSKYNYPILGKYFKVKNNKIVVIINDKEDSKTHEALARRYDSITAKNDQRPYRYRGRVKARMKNSEGKLKLQSYSFELNENRGVVSFKRIN